jgi:hypothetical protein
MWLRNGGCRLHCVVTFWCGAWWIRDVILLRGKSESFFTDAVILNFVLRAYVTIFCYCFDLIFKEICDGVLIEVIMVERIQVRICSRSHEWIIHVGVFYVIICCSAVRQAGGTGEWSIKSSNLTWWRDYRFCVHCGQRGLYLLERWTRVEYFMRCLVTKMARSA